MTVCKPYAICKSFTTPKSDKNLLFRGQPQYVQGWIKKKKNPLCILDSFLYAKSMTHCLRVRPGSSDKSAVT